MTQLGWEHFIVEDGLKRANKKRACVVRALYM